MKSADPFEAIVAEYHEPLFRFAMSLTREESDARDLTQQTFCIWATKGYQLRDYAKVRTWLFTTLHRAYLASKRRQVRFPHHELNEVSNELPMLSPEGVSQSDTSQVLSALAVVDGVYQDAVALFYLEDCSYKDIAAILEVPVGTVKSRIARGLMQLREILLSDDARPLCGAPAAASSVSVTGCRPVRPKQTLYHSTKKLIPRPAAATGAQGMRLRSNSTCETFRLPITPQDAAQNSTERSNRAISLAQF